MRAQLRILAVSLSVCFVLPFAASAKTEHTKIQLDSSKQIKITYTSPSWNLDSEKIDTAFLILRDANTGQIAQIQLEETAPDSGQFVGTFGITFGSTNNLSPEIYIPSQDDRTKNQQEILKLVNSGKLQRKPVIIKTEDNGQKVIDVFDSHDEAAADWKAYQEELKVNKRKLIKPAPGDQNMAAAQQAEYKKKMMDLEKQAAAHESERVRLERVEREKLAVMQKNFQKLSAKEQAAHLAKSKRLFDEGMKDYQAGQFPASEQKFHEAIEADPMQTQYYFNYGVAVYRQERDNEAMVAMRIAPDDQKTIWEKKYYMGLIHLRLKELKEAGQLFDEVGASKDPVLGPSALFYKGVLLYSDGKFEASKKPFEDVLDTSKDPDLDKQAEDYLERANQALMFQKMQEKKWNVTGIVGMFYDSNVLLAPDNQAAQGSVLKTGDMRLLTVGTLEYRPIFDQHNEWSVKGTANLTNSSQADVSAADPWIYTFEAPYVYKGVLWSKGYKLTVRPGYEITYMALTAGSPKGVVFDSPYIAFDNTFVIHPNWFSTYTFQYRHDESMIPYSTPGDSSTDYTANQYYLKTTQMFLLDNSKQQSLSANGGFMRNEAIGNQKTYDRYEIGATYSRPVYTNWVWNAGLSYYYLNYADAGRTDNNLTFSSGVAKPINDWFIWGLTAMYSTNNSTIPDQYEYQKYIIMTTATFNTMF